MATTSSGRLVKTSCQFTPDQHAWLEDQARRTGESIATIVRQLVRDAMQIEKSEAA